MSDTPPPERQFVEDLRRHKAWGIAFVLGVVTLAGYLAWQIVRWLGLVG